MSDKAVQCIIGMMTTVLLSFMTGVVCLAEDQAASASDQGMVTVPDYSGEIGARSNLTGDWGGLRQDWANRGVTVGFDWYQAYQNIVDGGTEEGGNIRPTWTIA